MAPGRGPGPGRAMGKPRPTGTRRPLASGPESTFVGNPRLQLRCPPGQLECAPNKSLAPGPRRAGPRPRWQWQPERGAKSTSLRLRQSFMHRDRPCSCECTPTISLSIPFLPLHANKTHSSRYASLSPQASRPAGHLRILSQPHKWYRAAHKLGTSDYERWLGIQRHLFEPHT
jgi:hypothetical protein